MNNPTSTLGRTVKVMKRWVCVTALVLLFLAVGVGGVSSHEARAQGSPSMDATDCNTAEVEVAPTETIVPTTATVSPDPSADGWNKDMATVTSRARYKTH
jgi:hypothetical protein